MNFPLLAFRPWEATTHHLQVLYCVEERILVNSGTAKDCPEGAFGYRLVPMNGNRKDKLVALLLEHVVTGMNADFLETKGF